MDLDQCACSGRTLDRLLRPAVLALLAREKTHGYDVVQKLKELEMFAEVPPDTSGVYKVLKSMEEEGLICSNWEFGDMGPAKKQYALTKQGKDCLKKWAETLRAYRAQIDGLLTLLDLNQELTFRNASPKCGCQRKRTVCRTATTIEP
jgi:DNA-binding PadR family transcriptional regulator